MNMRPIFRLAARCALLAAGTLAVTHARGQDPDSRARLDSLEARMRRLELRINRIDPDPRSQTRSAIESGRFGGFVLADNKGVSLEIGGFVQFDAIHDFHRTSNHDAFQPSSILIPNDHKTSTSYSIRQTRFNFIGTIPIGKNPLKTILEFDLFNPDGSSVPRLRHAWGEYGRFGAGQYWSNFMDIDVFPNTLDYYGPNSMVFTRQVQVRYTQPVGEHTKIAVSLEKPSGNITLPADSGYASLQQLPDAVLSIRHDWGTGNHIKLAGAFHPLTYETPALDRKSAPGWGVNLTGAFQLPNKDNFVYQAAYGEGIANYLNDIGGNGYDAIYHSPEKKLNTVPALGLMGFYDHWWSDKWSTTAGWAYLTLKPKAYQPPADFNWSHYGVGNLLWYPNGFMKVGIEYLYGYRNNIDGMNADNHRLQLSAMFKF
ncbi:DcaP family trimeric outer membrane transporter [Chitinophaga sp. NPDC101104]|uniref:DcaP family trimeric outer membrane transporter n=1 Tax=Chitinophaga sp. NPDC101104 TaxID=3390561 RepID=UPI003D066C1A